MKTRGRFLLLYGIVYIVLVSLMSFGLNYWKNRQFSMTKVAQMIEGRPRFELPTKDLCATQLLGEPKVGENYVKISFNCVNGTKSVSTLALEAFKDQSIAGVLDEFGRIVNYDGVLSTTTDWECLINMKPITANVNLQKINPASSIDCFQLGMLVNKK